MTKTINEQLDTLSKLPEYKSVLSNKLIGLEKESLRIFQSGELANTNHPKSLGDKLTNHFLTTDYAESQLEVITKPYPDFNKTLEELEDIHKFIYQNINQDQTLWPFSIPGKLPKPKDISIARYGSSIKGQIKELYRTGLEHRYGKVMQLICGIHYNFSFSDDFWQAYFPAIKNHPKWSKQDINNSYMSLIRNYMRISWLSTYLFGASPAISNKFIHKDIAIANYLKPFKDTTYLTPYGTSVRESNLGYHNKSKVTHMIDYNSMQAYANSLYKAVNTIDPEFQELGKFRGNKQIQINCNLLQIENEYYGTIRPKPSVEITDVPLYKALHNYGISYIELRNLDLNPFNYIGIEYNQGLFLEVVMYYCLLLDSPEFTPKERAEIKANSDKIALLGRQPQLQLIHNGHFTSMKTWANDIFQDLKIIGEYLDQAYGKNNYTKCIEYYQTLIHNPEQTLSAKIIQELIKNDCDYTDYFLTKAKEYTQYYAKNKLASNKLTFYNQLAADSIKAKQQIEEHDKTRDNNIDTFLAEYYG